MKKLLILAMIGTLLFGGAQMTMNPVTVQAAEESTATEMEFLAACDETALAVWDDELAEFTESQKNEIKDYMDKNIIGDVTDDYKKAALIFDWIVENIDYTHDNAGASPYAVFKSKKAVCGGYSNLYKAMLNLEGIPAVVLVGDVPGGGHAWNAVYTDGRWFYADSTWGAGWFDVEEKNFNESHWTTRAESARITTENGIILGYDHGISVVGTASGVTDAVIPDDYREFEITSVSYQLFADKYGVKTVTLGKNIVHFDLQFTSKTLEAINVSEDNENFASKDGVLFSKDFTQLYIYPPKKSNALFVLPKETISFDEKQTFVNSYLSNLEVEEGNSKYTSYDGALYNAEQTELLVVPTGKETIIIPENASISGMAFANADLSKLTIYGTLGSPAEEYANMYHINFVDVKEMPEEVSVSRIFGAARYETSYKIADQLKETLGVSKFESVVVATGKNFADALAGSYLAVEKDAPILLTNGKSDNIAALHDYIKANVAEGGKVYILGGEAAVPAEAAIDGYDVVRLSGKSRYETNLAILNEAGAAGDAVIVATGKAFADSLSASAAKLPILLVKPGTELNDEQKAVVEGKKDIYIIGGTGAVSEEAAEELAAFGTVTRVSGKTRYETSAAVANTFFADIDAAVVASGKNFPDGLCGGPLAAAMNAPLILTADGKTEAAEEYIQSEDIKIGYVLGGTGALSDESVVNIFKLKGAEEIAAR